MKSQNLEVVKYPYRIFSVPVLCQVFENLHVVLFKAVYKIAATEEFVKNSPSYEISKA